MTRILDKYITITKRKEKKWGMEFDAKVEIGYKQVVSLEVLKKEFSFEKLIKDDLKKAIHHEVFKQLKKEMLEEVIIPFTRLRANIHGIPEIQIEEIRESMERIHKQL